MSETRAIEVVRVRGGARANASDRVALEEPLEIRLHGRPFAVIMRTPGSDRELAAGFLHAERVIIGADDLGTIEYCTDRRSETVEFQGRTVAENIVNVTLTDRSPEQIEQLFADRRNVMTNSSCGLCGRQTIESLLSDVAPLKATWTIATAALAAIPDRLRARQAAFDETGGLHAAGLFTPDATLVDIAEDVGRHNAVDKIIGRQLMRDALPLSNHLLCVSGRTSYEIVQKAIFAGIPIVAAVSAPSSLAIDLARDSGVTLVGFVRGESFNIYAHAERVGD
jgi:FdhD protein